MRDRHAVATKEYEGGKHIGCERFQSTEYVKIEERSGRRV